MDKDKTERIKEFTVEELLPHIGRDKPKIEHNEYTVRTDTRTLQCFAEHGIECQLCGLKGEFFVMEKNLRTQQTYLHLYGVDTDDEIIMMTKDHIVPKSRLGSNDISNLRTMCERCNNVLSQLNQARYRIKKRRDLKGYRKWLEAKNASRTDSQSSS
jgi:5-methylcytosine-specific restriction endonuclease McrA